MKKILDVINKLTPENDKLAHYFWGDIYSTVGLLLVLILNLFTSTAALALLPFLSSAIPAYLKERMDGKGYGTRERADFIYTVVSSMWKSVLALFYVLV